MFTIDGIIFDRIQLGIMENVAGTEVLGFLPQMSTASIETTAESKDATDKDGTLIKRFYNAKAANITATNQIISMDALGQVFGSGKVEAGEGSKVIVPKVIVVKAGTADVTIDATVVEDSITVTGYSFSGAKGASYVKGAGEASNTDFKYESDSHKITLPTGTNEQQFLIKYNRELTADAFKIVNKADKFPSTVRLTVKALAIDPCTPDTLRACYVIFPSLQLDPSTTMEISTDATFDLKGDAQVNYCSEDKELFTICMAADDDEE